MKKLILSALTFLSLSLSAQTVPCNIAGNFTATGDSIILDNRNLGCYQWRVAYTSQGFTGISISLQEAATSGGMFTDFTGSSVVTDGTNPSTSTTNAIIGIHSNGAFIKLHLATATGTGKLIYQVWGANSTTSIASLSSGGGTGVTAVTASAPITSSGGSTPNISASYQGNGAKIQASTGSTTADNCVKFDGDGNTVDAGLPCGITNLGCRITGPSGGTQTLTNNTLTALTFDTVIRDDGGFSNLATDPTILTAPTTGWYIVAWSAGFTSSAFSASRFSGFITINGSIGVDVFNVSQTATFQPYGTGSTVIFLSSGDTVGISMLQASGGSAVVQTSVLSIAYIN